MKNTMQTCLWLCLSLFVFGSAMAVDKTVKVDKAPKKEIPTTDTAHRTKKVTPLDQDVTGKAKSPKSYDNFIDTNNNGIDDRLEKGQSTPKQRSKSDSTQTTTSPNKP